MNRQALLTLLEYNYWENARLMAQLERLTPEQLHEPARVSHGTAFELARHMLDVEWSWHQFARGEPGQQYLWEVVSLPDLPAIRNVWQVEHARTLNFVSNLREEDLERDIDYGTAQGRSPSYAKLWQLLLHSIDHGIRHRSELSRYLEDCGHPLEESDLLVYLKEIPVDVDS